MLNNVIAPNQYYGMAQQSIINSNFERWVRGTSFTNPLTGVYMADRWKLATNVLSGAFPANVIHSQQLLTAGDISNSYYFYRINVDGAGTGQYRYQLKNIIENGTSYLCGAGKKVTVSFYAKSSIVGKRIGVSLSQVYGTGGSPSATETLTGGTVTLTTSWVRYSITITTNTLVGKTFGTNNDDTLILVLAQAWDTATQSGYNSASAETFVGAGNIDVAQFQLSAGDTVLTFQPKDQVVENLGCQRYAITYSDANTSFPIGNGFALSTTVARIQVELPQTMRVAPTLTATATDWQISDGVTATDLTAISIVSGQSSNKTVTLLCTVASGLTQFRPYQLIADGTANRLMLFDAEL